MGLFLTLNIKMSRPIRIKIFLIAVLCLATSMASKAQNVALSTDLVEWANFGTANLNVSVSLSRHVSMNVGGRYNPWTFQTAEGSPIYNNQTTGYVGFRYWLWYVYSGWWFGTKIQYMDFKEAGVLRPKVFDGKSVGAGLSFGYTWMLSKHFNIETSCGMWGGRHYEYSVYRTTASMELLRSGPKNFIFFDDFAVSLMYVF